MTLPTTIFPHASVLCLAAAFAAPTSAQPLTAQDGDARQVEVPRPAHVEVTLRCGEDLAARGTVQVRLPGAAEVLEIAIEPDGTVGLPPMKSGWAQILGVHAWSEGATSWCLDTPIAVPSTVGAMSLNLSPAFTIKSFGPKVPDLWASGTAVLVREAGVQCARKIGSSEVAETFGQIAFEGLRRGSYRVVLPWSQREYLSIGSFQLEGAPRNVNELGFGSVQHGQEAREDALRLEPWPGEQGQRLWRGAVVDQAGKAVSHAIVRLVRSNQPGPRLVDKQAGIGAADSFDAITDGEGRYELRGVRSGTYLVGARPQAGVPGEAEAQGKTGAGPSLSNAGTLIRFDSVTFPGASDEGEETPFTLTTTLPPRGLIRGQVTGAAHQGLRVIATSRAYFGQLGTEVGPDGRFTLEGAPPGDFTLHLAGGPASGAGTGSPSKTLGPLYCLEAAVLARVPGPEIQLAAIQGVDLDVVAAFAGTRPSSGWLQVVQLPEEGSTAVPSLPRAPTAVRWRGIGVAKVSGLSPGRYRVTFREDAHAVTADPLRFAEKTIVIPKGTKKNASTQLNNFGSKKLTLFNDDPDHSILVELRDSQGALFTVEIQPSSDETVTVPAAFFKEIPLGLTASVRSAPNGQPWTKPIPENAWQLHYPGKK